MTTAEREEGGKERMKELLSVSEANTIRNHLCIILIAQRQDFNQTQRAGQSQVGLKTVLSLSQLSIQVLPGP